MKIKKNIIAILFVFIGLNNTFSQPAGYYNDALGLTGAQLKEALRTIITNGHTSNSYSNLEDDFYYTDNLGSSKIWDMYSQNGSGVGTYYFYYNSGDECGSYNSEGDCYNKEHSFPASWFDEATPMYADLFHVIPTDGYVNNQRGNYPFGEVDFPTYTSSNGSKLGTCSFPGYSGMAFEPVDDYKGDFARNYFYMATRYDMSTFTSDMISGDGFAVWARDLLVKWHIQDPVSTKETNRNNAVYNIQGNRNPYIDHPEWVCEVFGGDCSSLYFITDAVTTVNSGVQYTYNIYYFGSTSVTCSGNPAWLSFSNISTGFAKLQGTPTLSDIGSSNIVLTISNGKTTVNQNFTLVVSTPTATQTIFNKNFNDNTLLSGGWSYYSVSGTLAWSIDYYGSSYYAYMSGFDYTNNTNEDWLISPKVNFDVFTDEVLTFRTAGKFTGNPLKLYYSKNYSGSGNPNSSTWTEITGFALSTGDTWTWVNSGNIDLSTVTGSSVYIGFKYTSTTSAARAWELDDVKLLGIYPGTDINTVNQDFNLSIYPNPATDFINIDYYLSENSQVIIDIYDITGQKVCEVLNENQNSGNHSLTWNSNDLLISGIYMLNIKNGNQNFYKKIILNK